MTILYALKIHHNFFLPAYFFQPKKNHMPSNKMKSIKKGLDKITCWGKGTFYYEGINLRNILDEVERQFNTKIVCHPAGLGDQIYSGYFINTHLDSALMSICWPLRIRYENDGNHIVVSRSA